LGLGPFLPIEVKVRGERAKSWVQLVRSRESEVNLRNFFIKQTQSPSIISYHNLGQKNQPASVNTVMIYLTCLPTLIKFPSMFSRRAGRNSQSARQPFEKIGRNAVSTLYTSHRTKKKIFHQFPSKSLDYS
jgi:hypothetical protein